MDSKSRKYFWMRRTFSTTEVENKEHKKKVAGSLHQNAICKYGLCIMDLSVLHAHMLLFIPPMQRCRLTGSAAVRIYQWMPSFTIFHCYG